MEAHALSHEEASTIAYGYDPGFSATSVPQPPIAESSIEEALTGLGRPLALARWLSELDSSVGGAGELEVWPAGRPFVRGLNHGMIVALLFVLGFWSLVAVLAVSLI